MDSQTPTKQTIEVEEILTEETSTTENAGVDSPDLKSVETTETQVEDLTPQQRIKQAEERLKEVEELTRASELETKLLEAEIKAKEAENKLKNAQKKLDRLNGVKTSDSVNTSTNNNLPNVNFGSVPDQFKPTEEMAEKAQEIMNDLPQDLQDDVMQKTMKLMNKNPVAFQKAMNGDYSQLMSDPEYLSMMQELMKNPDYMSGMAKMQQMQK